MTSDELVKRFDMQPHPEGGFYKETYRSAGAIPGKALPKGFHGDRAFSTAILYLLPKGGKSKLHRLASDELFHFYSGGPMRLVELLPGGKVAQTRLGADIAGGCEVQRIVRAGTWFGAYAEPGSEYCLVGCTVAPGFDFSDFQMADAARLAREFPHARDVIHRLMS